MNSANRIARVALELGVERELNSHFERWRKARREGDVLLLSHPYWCDYADARTPLPPAIDRLLLKRKPGDFTAFRNYLTPYSNSLPSPLVHREPEWVGRLRQETRLPVYGIAAAAEDLPFNNGTLHKIVLRNVLGDPLAFRTVRVLKAVASEFNRVLTPGGRVELLENVTPPSRRGWARFGGLLHKQGFSVRRRALGGFECLAAVKPTR